MPSVAAAQGPDVNFPAPNTFPVGQISHDNCFSYNKIRVRKTPELNRTGSFESPQALVSKVFKDVKLNIPGKIPCPLDSILLSIMKGQHVWNFLSYG